MNQSELTMAVGRSRTLGAMCCAMLLPYTCGAQAPAANGAAAPPAAAVTAKPAGAEAGGDKRLQEVLTLKFDRTPLTVLTAQAKLIGTNLAADSVELFRLRLIAGQWKDAGQFIATLPAQGQAPAFEAVLKALEQSAAAAATGGGPDRSPVLMPEEIADLSDMAPGPLSPDQIKLLAALLKRALAAEQNIEPLLQRLEKGTKWLGGTDTAKRERAADLMIETGRARDSLRMLPPLVPGRETASFPVLEKYAKQLVARGRQEQQRAEDFLESWRLNQILLTAPGVPPPMKDRAWRRMADLMRWTPAEKTAEALETVAKEGPLTAIELLKQVTVQVNDDRPNREPNNRKQNLQMQRQVAGVVAPMGASSESVRYALNQFALTWIDEASYARKVYVPPRQNTDLAFDRYGNVLQMPDPQMNQNQPKPVAIADLLESAPDQAWRNVVDVSLRPRLLALEADLALKQDNEVRALPLVEELAPLDAKEGQRLVNEVLRVWAKTHSSNRSENSAQLPYYVSQQSPQGIPLTRAAQRRNLAELAAVYARLRALGLPVERPPLVNAFTRAHSSAEVFQGESIEQVFGKPEQIDVALYADLLQSMRTRLAGQWRKPAVQQQAKTQRTDAQIDAEVQKGYELVTSLATKALERQPDDWRLMQVSAATQYDWAEFQYGRKVDLAVYTERRERAFSAFGKASALYGTKLGTMERKEETTVIYQQWLNAQLGASDLGQVTRQQDPEGKLLGQIRTAILALPGEAAPRHMSAFAKAVSNSMGGIPAQLRPVYLKAAMAVIGENTEASKIREALAHYTGLLQELELDLRLDGDATVGHGQPFGAFLALRHTADIERESAGGFSKYLRNATNNYYGSYQGAPVDHRDLLEKGIREKLADRFEVVSISFHDAKLQSYGYGREGWRETPLAYLLLKAKDPAVDRLPTLQLNMEFGDRQGAVILPVASPVLLIDAKPDVRPVRPMTNLEVTQTLDERALGEGMLSLEVKATCSGLISKFEDVFEFHPGAFKVEEMNDSGPAVQRLSSDGPTLAAISERTWLIKMAYDKGQGGNASTATFGFPRAKSSDAKVVYKRYRDADLVEVSPEVALAGLPLGRGWGLSAALLGGVLVTAVGLVVVFRRQRPDKGAVVAPEKYRAPAVVTPFTTLHLLRTMHGDAELNLPDQARSELSETITRVESFYFAAPNDGTGAPNLSHIVSEWLNRISGRQVPV